MWPVIRPVTLLFYRSVDAAGPPTIPGAVAFRIVSNSEMFPWDTVPRREYHDVFRNRFDHGHLALIGSVDNRHAFLAWIARDALVVDEIATLWNLPPAQHCLYDVVTEETFRGRGLYPDAISWYARQHAGHMPRGCTWIYCDAKNTASQRGIEKAAYSYHCSVRAVWVGKYRVARMGRLPGHDDDRR
jgi:hypothetical protein